MRQMAQSENLDGDSAVTVSFGREERMFFLRSLLAEGGGGVVEEPRKGRRQEQRATATWPKTQMRAARIRRKSESEEEMWSPKNLQGRVMLI